MASLAVLLAVLLAGGGFAAVAAGCSKDPAGVGRGPSRRIGLALERAAVAGRFALGDLAYAGLERQVRERGGRIYDLAEGQEPKGRAAGLDARCLASALEGRDGDQLLRVLAEEGRDLIVGVGPSFSGPLARVAKDYPRTRFALIGADAGALPEAPNLASLSFDDAQGAFLIGALAGYMVSGKDMPGAPKPKLGFIGGADTDATEAYQSGFQAGAAYAAPALRKPGALLAQYCGRYAAAFDDPAVARAIADSQYKKGARILFHAAGASGRGLFEAARAAGALAMGSGGDPVGGPVVASMREGADVAMSRLIEELFSTGTVKAGARTLGLKDGAVDFAIDAALRDSLASILPRVEEARARIASGEIAVPSDGEAAARFIKSLK